MIRILIFFIVLTPVAKAQSASPTLWCHAQTEVAKGRTWAPDCESYFVNTFENGRRFSPRTVQVWYEVRHGIATHLIDPTSEVRQRLLEGAPICLDQRVDVTAIRWQGSNEVVMNGTRTCNGNKLHRSFVVDTRTGHVLSTGGSPITFSNSPGR
jgi:hypothetical protein